MFALSFGKDVKTGRFMEHNLISRPIGLNLTSALVYLVANIARAKTNTLCSKNQVPSTAG